MELPKGVLKKCRSEYNNEKTPPLRLTLARRLVAWFKEAGQVMAYAIFRTEKYKNTDKAKGVMAHHLRESPGAAPNADPTHSHLNITIGAPTRSALTKAVNERLATCTRKPRPDANRIVELMCTASPEFFEDKSYDEKKAYLLDCVEFAKHKFGAENVVGAYLHFDEKSPNVHIMCVPLETSMRTTKKMTREITALNAGHYFGGKEKMVVWQDEFAAFVQGRGYDLKRGEPKAETGRDHTPVAQYWKDQKQHIDAASVAAADHLDDAATQSRVAAELLAIAVDEAQRTGFEAQTLMVQRGSLDAEQSALAELRAAMQRQGAALDQEWGKLRAKAGDLETRERHLASNESIVVMKQQSLDIRHKTAVERADHTKELLAQVRELKTVLQTGEDELRQRQRDILRAEEVSMLVATPELVGMVEFLAERKDARDLISLLKADPGMASMVQQQIEVAVSLTGADLRAPWTQAYEDVDWAAVQRATADAVSSGGPAGP